MLHSFRVEQQHAPSPALFLMDTIIRKYNYRLETGTVGTDNDNIAAILYNINRMEMTATFSSTDKDKIAEKLGGLVFMVVDSKVHLRRFLKASAGKTSAATVAAVESAFDNAIKIADDDNLLSDNSNTSEACAVFPKVYKMLLGIVPSILALDAQAVGRV